MSDTMLKSGYFTHKIKTKFTILKTFYIMWMPVQMSKYGQIKKEFIAKNKTVDLSIGMIEKAKAFGFGWIGLADEDGDIEINKDFIAYKIVGEYKQMKEAYRKIMKDYPNIDEFYNLYLTDPDTTKTEENITYILFTIK